MRLFLIAALVATVAAHAHGEHHNHSHHEHDEDHHCGTVHDDVEMAEAEMIAQSLVEKVCSIDSLKHIRVCLPYEERIQRPVEIPVWYHIVHAGDRGRLTDAQINAQFAQTNKDFSGQEDQSIPGWVKMDITFKLAGFTRTDNSLWFSDLDRYESQIKNAVAVDNRYNFNQYFGDLSAGLLGFCYFPNSFPESSSMHGCVNLYSSIPGAGGNYGEGKTTTHETGHGIGLYHTFQGGCRGNGDQVSDTCNQASPTNGCPTSRDSCGDGCPDPINNYMDYSFDRCMTQFTSGQNVRANQQLFTFRPSLYLNQEEIDAIETYLPGAWNEALAFGKINEAKYMAKRSAKGYSD